MFLVLGLEFPWFLLAPINCPLYWRRLWLKSHMMSLSDIFLSLPFGKLTWQCEFQHVQCVYKQICVCWYLTTQYIYIISISTYIYIYIYYRYTSRKWWIFSLLLGGLSTASSHAPFCLAGLTIMEVIGHPYRTGNEQNIPPKGNTKLIDSRVNIKGRGYVFVAKHVLFSFPMDPITFWEW